MKMFKTSNHGVTVMRKNVFAFSLIWLCFFLKVAASGLSTNLPPGHNFDLSAFKLQTLRNDLTAFEVTAASLTAGYTNRFFYTDPLDGSMVFWVPSNANSLSGPTGYPRSELRQISNGANWPLTDTKEHYMMARCRVTSTPAPKPQIIIGQIHGSENNSEMLKLRWTGQAAGSCRIEARFQNNDAVGAEYGVTLASGLSLGDMIAYSIIMTNGTITVTVNGNSASQTYTTKYYGTTDRYYFKAGNYLQYENDTTVYDGDVKFYALSLSRPSDYFWTNTASTAWSVAGSWTNGFAPVAGGAKNYAISFDNAGTYRSTNDLGNGFLLNRLNFGGAAVTLIGNSFAFTNSGAALPEINHYGASTVIISNAVRLGANVTFGGTGSGTVAMAGAISGTGGLVKRGAGKLILSGTNTFTGAMITTNGTLSLANTNCLGTSTVVYIYSGATNELNYEGDLAIDKLYIDGVLLPNGRYGEVEVPSCIKGAGYLSVSGVPQQARNGARFHPDDFASIGTITGDMTNLTFNTDTGEVTPGVAAPGVPGVSESGTVVTVFCFDSVVLSNAPTIVGSRPIVIMSKSNLTLSAGISVNGGNGSHGVQGVGVVGGYNGGDAARTDLTPGNPVDGQGPGGSTGYNGTADTITSGGGGYGGVGGGGDYSGGSIYGNKYVDNLLGGSGAGGTYNKGGGAGGGAIELTAAGTLTITASGTVSAKGGSGTGSTTQLTSGGGSGGAILLVANAVNIEGAITVQGGNGGNASGGQSNGGGGGGGRVAVYYVSSLSTNSGIINISGGLADGGDGTGKDGALGSLYIGALSKYEIPETWFTDFNLTNGIPGVIELEDPDGDNSFTWQEYVAGTDPTNITDAFCLQISYTNGQSIVSFESRTTTSNHYGSRLRYYSLEYLTDLMTTNWSVVQGYSNIPASGLPVTYTNNSASNLFYRANIWLE